tara:strand:+ start:170 stop:541 length:372 start_codon:yes stop_codon:yes gene_type:complete
MTLIKTKEERFTEFFNNLSEKIDIEFNHYLDFEEDITLDDVTDTLRDKGAMDVEINYYSAAIKYLMKRDPSLTESLELASEMGYSTDNLNSEILASLLATEHLNLEYYELNEEIEEFLTELNK